MVARKAHNLEVVGSNPTSPIFPFPERDTMTKRDEQAREYAEESGSLDGYHPMVRDFILGQGCFSQENEAEMHRRVGRKLGERVAKAMTDAVMEAFGMIPKSASPSSAVEPENKGDSMRTERITLEVTHGESFGASHWSWVTILRLQSGESVRVVEDGDSWRAACESARIASGTIADITAERDAAIRERDRLRHLLNTKEDECRSHHPWVHPTAAPAASVVPFVIRDTTDIIRSNATEDEKHAALATLVEAVCPGYVLAPAASGAAGAGWLTAEERSLIESLEGTFQQNADALRSNGLHGHVDNWERKVKLFRSILGRSSPPEVLLPVSWREAAGDVMSADEVRAALASAGVTVKEVG